MSSDEDTLCCMACRSIDVLWPRIERARSILQHRPANAETVALALKALEGAPADSTREEG